MALLKIRQAAARLGVTDHLVEQSLRCGRLRGVRLGSGRGQWRIPEEEVERLLHGEREEVGT
jgi:excisionase family DNA binding protein